jgi:arabinogalactan oligomer / maltooligosaccharide transport system substrate-binding protein
MKFRTLLPPFIAILALVGAFIVAPVPASAANPPIIIWVDAQMRPAVRDAFPARFRKSRVIVRAADTANIGTVLAETDVASAPDLVLIANEQLGGLAQANLLDPISVPSATAASLNRAALAGFRFDQAIYGVPVLRQNLAMISNVNLVPQAPATFARLSKRALAVVANGRATVPFAVAQGPEGNAESTYPLFSGLGGYVFGAANDGSLKADDTGLANPTFRKNTAKIREWNQSGLLRSSLTEEEARTAFLAGQAPFWITGPQDVQRLKTGSFRYRITPVPPIVPGITPASLVKSWGFVRTNFAKQHGVDAVAQRFLNQVVANADVQAKLSQASPIVGLPGSTPALAKIGDRVLLAFGAAATSAAVPVPNLVQWPTARGLLAAAWRESTSGADARRPRPTFVAAEASLRAAEGATSGRND